MDHHQVAGEYPRLQHGFPPHLQREVLSGEAVGVKGDVFLNVLLSQDGGARRHVAHQGHLILASRGAALDGDGPGLALRLGDIARFPQALQVEVDGGGGFQLHRLRDFPHRGGIAVFVGKVHDIIVNLLLLWG